MKLRILLKFPFDNEHDFLFSFSGSRVPLLSHFNLSSAIRISLWYCCFFESLSASWKSILAYPIESSFSISVFQKLYLWLNMIFNSIFLMQCPTTSLVLWSYFKHLDTIIFVTLSSMHLFTLSIKAWNLKFSPSCDSVLCRTYLLFFVSTCIFLFSIDFGLVWTWPYDLNFLVVMAYKIWMLSFLEIHLSSTNGLIFVILSIFSFVMPNILIHQLALLLLNKMYLQLVEMHVSYDTIEPILAIFI